MKKQQPKKMKKMKGQKKKARTRKTARSAGAARTRNERKERKETERLGFAYAGKEGEFRVPEWWECAWRRVPCGKETCKLCGPIVKSRARHAANGEDPDDIAHVLEDAGNSLGEALRMIKKDAERMGIDIENLDGSEEPPRPDEFQLYREIAGWRELVGNIVDAAERGGELWIETEAAADLLWYRNILAAKTYRQLCNRWHRERDDGYGDFDYRYTRYVLRECFTILEQALGNLSLFFSREKIELALALSRLHGVERDVLGI